MRGIPALMVESPVSGLLQFNTFPAGETGPEKRIAIPTAADGVNVLHLMPLEPGYLPLTCRIRMKDGLPAPPGDEAGRLIIRSWPGGVAEVILRPEKLPPPGRLPLSPASASRVSFTAGGRRLAAEWAGFGDWWLVVEEGEGTPLLTRAVPEATGSGPITVQHWEGQPHVVAQAPAGGEQRCVTVAGQRDGRWQALFSETGQSVEITGDGVWVSHELRDIAGHRRQRVWRPDGSVDDRITAQSPPGDRAPADIARAFLEALALGLDEEAAGLLTPALRNGLNIAEVRDFLGEIHEILPCRYGQPPGQPGWAVVRPAGSGLFEVASYFFSVTDGLIDNIVPG